MVRVIIESDKPIAVNVKKQDYGMARLLQDLEEERADESNEKTFAANNSKAN